MSDEKFNTQNFEFLAIPSLGAIASHLNLIASFLNPIVSLHAMLSVKASYKIYKFHVSMLQTILKI